ncbi:hypothetical protein E8K88_13640 [Lampropedia aestuarii]|uniref:DUF3160 domain-containing protein n=1 Tax=Lampropedia aestuarii TaxID=2562762 RepID=A0A4S5BHU8_9BURK|nr:hypothetical protein [Lampropedia aestuarii]THJ31870.1 hypothetical protein E8K88_13640 [Lampropedia aestuarii]
MRNSSTNSSITSHFLPCTRWLKKPIAQWSLLASCVLLSACSSQAPEHPLQYAPANSLFVAANLEPLPEQARQFQATVSAPLKALWAQWLPYLEKDLPQDEGGQRAQHLLNYLGRTLSEQGLAGFGIAPNALYALYEVELHPVLRLAVSEPAKLRQLITEIETFRGRSYDTAQLEHLTYWRIPLSDIHPQQLVNQVERLSQHNLYDAPWADLEPLPRWSGTDSPVMAPHLLVALSDKDLVVTFERPTEASLRPKLLGIEKPASTIWDAKTLQKVNERHGLSPYGTFWLETARVLQLAGIAPETASAKEQEQAKQRSIIHTSLSGACVRELTQLAAQVPELVVGVTEMNATLFKAKMSLALEPAVREDWRQMQAPLQGWQAQPGLMELGLSMRIDKLAAWLQKTMNAVHAKPFECEQLQPLNAIAQSPKTIQSLAPLYAVGSTATGFYARLTDLEMHDDAPIPKGMVLAQSANPRGLLAYLSMMTPKLAQMSIQPGMAPQPFTVASEEWQAFNIPTFIGLSETALGVAAGDAAATQMHSLLAQAESEPAPFSFSRYSGAFFADIMEPIMWDAYAKYEAQAQQTKAALADFEGNTVPDAAAQQQEQELNEQARQAMRTAWNWVRLFNTVGDAATVGAQGLEYQFYIQLATTQPSPAAR